MDSEKKTSKRERKERKKPTVPLSDKDKVTYVKIVIATITGLANTLLGFVELIGLVLAVFMFVVSHYVAVFIFNVDVEGMGGQSKVLTTGIFSYLMVGLVVWVISYNILVVPILLAPTIPLP
ncbi:MAG: hypothetical protein ACTSUV_00640 [Candidatus Ranarchaeia archaeon]